MITGRTTIALLSGLAVSTAGAWPQAACADTLSAVPTLNYFGLPGVIEMPTANAMPDADLALTGAYLGGSYRGTLAFQALPRLTASFRYAGLDDFRGVSTDFAGGLNYDRSFDLHWQVVEEGGWWPAIAVGIRDLAGTGIYGSEYIVATRHFGANDQIAVTAGLGFGRLGERDGFSNPFGLDDRPVRDVGSGGTVNTDQYFRGDAALFGGVEWQATDRLRLQLEYSSDTYARESGPGETRTDSPINAGASYSFGDFASVGAHYLYGNTVALRFSLVTNPRRSVTNGTFDPAPEPVRVREMRDEPASTTWIQQANGPSILRDNLVRLFDEDGGLGFVSLALDTRRATIRVRNLRYHQEAQALGRVLRALTVTMPASVEVFEVIFVVNGLDTSRIRVARSEVETLEHDLLGAERLLSHAEVEDARITADPDLRRIEDPALGFSWGLVPYVETFLFDPEAPFRFSAGVQANLRYDFGNGLVAQGEVRAPVVGNISDAQIVDPVEPGGPFPVRSEAAIYNQESHVRLDNLTLSHYGRLGPDLYSRVSLGYLERMFAGISGEVLWQPANSEIAFGAELNHVWRRDFDGGFGLQDYSVTTGHVSAYFPLWYDYRGQVDVGRYLAGDYGVTLRLGREFANGWRIGAFATFTDVSFEEFGEGSFDKGIELSVPIAWFTGTSTRAERSVTLRPVQRDGGARLEVEGRLFDWIGDYHRPRLQETGGMVWR